MRDHAPDADVFRCLHDARCRIIDQGTAELLPLSALLDCQSAKQNCRNWIWHVPAEGADSGSCIDSRCGQCIVGNYSLPLARNKSTRSTARLVLHGVLSQPDIKEIDAAGKVGNRMAVR